MKISDLRFLYRYNDWANQKILAEAGKLTGEQFLAPRPYAHGSVRNTLVHILSAEWIWRMRCQERVSPTTLPDFDDFPTLAPLQERMQREAQAMQGYLLSLTDQDLDQVVAYRRTEGEPRENLLWHLLVHVVNHGSEHRSTLAAYLTEAGYSPGDMDIVHFTRQDFA